MKRAGMILILFILLTIIAFRVGCNNSPPPFVEYNDFAKAIADIQIDVLFPHYFPEHLNPQFNLQVKQKATISYTSFRREEQNGYSLYLSPFEYNELQNYPNIFSNIHIIVHPEDTENIDRRKDMIEYGEYKYNDIVVKSYYLNYEDTFTEEKIYKTILDLVFVYNEKEYVVATTLYGEVSNEMLMEIEEDLLKVVESMILPVTSR